MRLFFLITFVTKIISRFNVINNDSERGNSQSKYRLIKIWLLGKSELSGRYLFPVGFVFYVFCCHGGGVLPHPLLYAPELHFFEKPLCPVFTILKMAEFLHMLDKCLILFPLLFLGVEAILVCQEGEEKPFLNGRTQQE